MTRVGRLLRRSGLDEVPQLWNVILGQMSFVGPRPVTEGELARYGGAAGAYLAAMPGITGLWQVSGGSGLGYAARVRLDLRYTRRLSLPLDLWILARTGVIVARAALV